VTDHALPVVIFVTLGKNTHKYSHHMFEFNSATGKGMNITFF